MIQYTVIKGDNLTKIARKFGVPLSQVKEANRFNIEDFNLIFPGQIINIPSADFQIPEPPSIVPKKYIKGQFGRYHKLVPAFEAGNDGTNNQSLIESIPKYFSRSGDGIITAKGFTSKSGEDNNTMIIMGRDRSGEGEIDSAYADLRKEDSGYSTYQGAGAIDIVVGRVAPFPLSIPGKTFGPLFNTKEDMKELALETLDGIDKEDNNQPFFTPHPQVAMDAARIYLSQMTDVDENFKISKNIFTGVTVKIPKKNNKPVRTPASAVMLKADKLRMHARQDIKIVTGGAFEKTNSQGNEITKIGGIHLMAGNKAGEQQPIPKGDDLCTMLDDLVKKLSQLAGIVFTLADTQIKYNTVLASHVHHSPFYGLMCTPSLTGKPYGAATVVDQFTRVEAQIIALKTGLGSFKSKYIKAGSAKYINSRYNTTN